MLMYLMWFVVRAQSSSHAAPATKSPFLLHSPTVVRGVTPAVDMSTAVKPGVGVFSLSATPSTSSYYQGMSTADIDRVLWPQSA